MIGHGRVVLIGGGVPIWQIDYSALALSTGANSATINAALAAVGLSETRASVATVQTSSSTVVTTGIAANDARIGDAGYGRGFVFEEARTNLNANSRDMSAWAPGVTDTPSYDYAAGPDGQILADRDQIPGGAVYGRVKLGSGATVVRTGSAWLRATAGNFDASDRGVNLVAPGSAAAKFNSEVRIVLDAAWRRCTKTIAANASWQQCPANQPNSATDVVCDLWQVEEASFATEAIITTGTSASRAAARHLLDAVSRIVSAGRVGLSFRTIPKGSIGGANNYSANPYLWQYDANNYATINASTGTVTVVIAGTSFTTASGMTAAIGDVLDYWIEGGGGAMQTVVKARKNNGSVTTLGTSGSPQGTVPSAGGIDLFSNSGAAGHFTAWHQWIKAFASGQRDAWAV